MPAMKNSAGLDLEHIDREGARAGTDAALGEATLTLLTPGDATVYVVHTWWPGPIKGGQRRYIAVTNMMAPLDWDTEAPPRAAYLAGKLVRGTAITVIEADVLARFLTAFSAAYLAETERMSREVF